MPLTKTHKKRVKFVKDTRILRQIIHEKLLHVMIIVAAVIETVIL
jgi:hypothetical protein